MASIEDTAPGAPVAAAALSTIMGKAEKASLRDMSIVRGSISTVGKRPCCSLVDSSRQRGGWIEGAATGLRPVQYK